MGATAALIRKEVRQHALPFVFLGAIIGLGAIGLLGRHYLHAQSSSVYTGVSTFLQFALPGAAMLICGRIVVAEYRAKTQLFLEGLPLPRWQMVTVKYFLALAVLVAVVAAPIFVAGVLLSGHEAMTPGFAAMLASRIIVTAWFWHSFFFTTGMLGRYRWPLMVLIVFVVFALDTMTAWEVQRFGPFDLLNHQFGSEREQFPVKALREAIGLAGGMTILGFVLGLVREGNVSALLAERMSHREKVLVAVVLLGAVAAFSVLDDQRRKPPYDLTGAADAKGPGTSVKVAGPRAAAQRLATELNAELAELRDYLDIAALPVVLVTHRTDLDAGKFERGRLSKSDGFVVRANYSSPSFDRDRFVAWLIPELLDYRSHGRTRREPVRWIRDGVGEFWANRKRATEPLSADRALALRATYALSGQLREQDLAGWFRLRERVGEGVARGLAWSGLKTLAAKRGEQACRDFLRELYSPGVQRDIRATLHDLQHPWTETLARHAGMNVTEFVSAWNDLLTQARRDLASELAVLPRLTLAVSQKSATPATTLLDLRLISSPPPPEEVEYRIRYRSVSGLDAPIEEDDFTDESARARLDAPIAKELARSFSRGTRAIVGVAIYLPALGCDAISGWQRIDIGP
jgi:hypothetical protein